MSEQNKTEQTYVEIEIEKIKAEHDERMKNIVDEEKKAKRSMHRQQAFAIVFSLTTLIAVAIMMFNLYSGVKNTLNEEIQFFDPVIAESAKKEPLKKLGDMRHIAAHNFMVSELPELDNDRTVVRYLNGNSDIYTVSVLLDGEYDEYYIKKDTRIVTKYKDSDK